MQRPEHVATVDARTTTKKLDPVLDAATEISLVSVFISSMIKLI